MSNKRARLAAIYAQVPDIPDCKGECYRSCGPIAQLGIMTPYEYSRLRDAPHLEQANPVDCELLDADKRCSVYALRPLICRLWGTVDTTRMRCPYGCTPTRWLSVEEADRLSREAIALSGSQMFAFGHDSESAMQSIVQARQAAVRTEVERRLAERQQGA